MFLFVYGPSNIEGDCTNECNQDTMNEIMNTYDYCTGCLANNTCDLGGGNGMGEIDCSNGIDDDVDGKIDCDDTDCSMDQNCNSSWDECSNYSEAECPAHSYCDWDISINSCINNTDLSCEALQTAFLEKYYD